MTLGSLIFLIAVLHTLLANSLTRFANRFPHHSAAARLLHLLGEVEVILGLWAGVFVLGSSFTVGFETALIKLSSLNFNEPCFVATIMIVAATKPITSAASFLIERLARILPIPFPAAMVMCCLSIGPLLGSLITEPAAMTVTALILRDRLFSRKCNQRLKYAVLGTLFVNISIGGVLTHFAAPPVVMVARTWEWTTLFMMTHFGEKAVLAVLLNAGLLVVTNWKELTAPEGPLGGRNEGAISKMPPFWLLSLHLMALAAIVATSHFPAFFAGVLVFFIGSTIVTRDYQSELRLKEALLVGFFLAGLVVLGDEQHWWVSPLLPTLSPGQMFSGSAVLTSVMDNAAITFLAAKVDELSEALKYAVVAGAVVGGGMTVIANAPNPVGFAILRDGFEDSSISPLKLALSALVPTLVAAACFWFL